MRRIFLCLLLLLLMSGRDFAQALSLVGELRFPENYINNGADSTGGSDCWGWKAPDGTQYAIMGTLYGTHYVRIPDLTVVDSLFGAQLSDVWYHRDIKTWRNYALVVGEMRGPECGVQVVDLSYLPDSVHKVTTYRTALDSTSHNLSIDTANAMAYILKSDYSGCRIVDISNPASPMDVGVIITGSIHDVYARNDTAWIAEGTNQAYSVWDCSDPANPVMLGRITSPDFGYNHNLWPDESGKYFCTSEETDFKTVKIWDATNMSNITLVGQYLAPCQLVHNVHWMGDYLYLSHYESGVVVVDVSDPANPVEASRWDNYPWDESPNFNGCWGAFPFTDGGYVYGSTIEGRLTVLQFDPLAVEKPVIQNQVLGNPYPLPATESVKVPVTLETGQFIQLTLHDIQGKTVLNPEGQWLAAGDHEITLQLGTLAPGLYNLIMNSGNLTESTRVVIAE